MIRFNPLLPKSDLSILLCLTQDDFTLSKVRRFYSSKGNLLGIKGLNDSAQFVPSLYKKRSEVYESKSWHNPRPNMLRVAKVITHAETLMRRIPC